MDKIKNFNSKINYIVCDDLGYFKCNGSISDLCALYAFITYKLLKNGIDIKYLIGSMCNANDLFNDLK